MVWGVSVALVLVAFVLVGLYVTVRSRMPSLLIRPNRSGSIKYKPQLDEMLSKEECDRVFEDVIAMKEHWKAFPVPIVGKGMCYLGAARYIEGGPGYFESAQRLNPILMEKFAWLFEKIQQHYQKVLQRPVRLTEDAAVPGFHILAPDKWITHLMNFRLGRLHCDRYVPGAEDFFSFTLPIRLPSAGAGLLLFDETADDIPFRRRALLRHRPMEKIVYREGTLVTHDGRHYHMVAPSRMQNGEFRMALQGHGLLKDDVWQLYF